jgi:3-oxoacyl-[acyl-carrier-protein] synthase-3
LRLIQPAYICGTGSFLPGNPIPNDQMEPFIGLVNGAASRVGRRVLRWNGIETRHYALERDGTPTYSNASLAAHAVRRAAAAAGKDISQLQHLAAATTQGDLLVPGHAAQLHGELGCGPLEIASFQSVCGSALMAAKSAFQAVRTGDAREACAAASELSSRWFRPEFFEGADLIGRKGQVILEAEYLRWTLSDGGGAIWVTDAPAAEGVSLRIDWIDIVSLAHQFDPCMWAGAPMNERHDLLKSWSFKGPRAAFEAGAIALQQDFVLLKAIIRAWVGVYLKKVDEGRIDPSAVDHLLVHYSAKSLREEIIRLLVNTGGMVDEARWFNNLRTAGNTGSASIWIMLDALIKERDVKPGEHLLAVVPESGRGLVGFMQMTAVGPNGE